MSAKEPPTVVEAAYVAEVREPGQFPPVGPPEIAIAGRSNVGKSTLLNRLTQRKSLARTSKTPGRTRGLIFYDLAVRLPDAPRAPLRFVDLPGYGYAQVSHDERRGWQTLVESYVERRETLRLFLVLVDARRGIQDEEAQLLEYLPTAGIPAHVVVTKTDKLSAAERGAIKQKIRGQLGEVTLPVALVSGQTGEGVDRLWASLVHAMRTDPDDGSAEPG